MTEQISSAALPPGPVMVDVQGFTLTDVERARLQHPLTGGLILFARNFENRQQLSALCAEVRALRTDIVIAVDHEGGRVQRFRDDGFTPLPSMRKLGELWAKDASKAAQVAAETGYVLAAELRACGVDLSFTPVLDLDYGVSQVIGDRSFHRSPRAVAMLAEGLIRGLQKAGMAACGKHFPGHGAVEADSHHEIPVDERSLQEILDEDAAPYGWLGGLLLPAVMPAHVIYPKVDEKPAGFSEFWLQRVLRKALAYDGLIFSDDLTMEGASVAGNILQRAQAALGAGCDMVLVCNRPDLADELLASLEYQQPAEFAERFYRLMPSQAALDWDSLQADEHYQYARGLQSQIISS